MSISDNSSEVGQDEQRGHCEERLHDRPQRRLQLGQAGGGGGDRDRQRVLAAGQPGTYLMNPKCMQNDQNQNRPRI